MSAIKKNIPNFITALNILCGSFSVVLAFEGYILWAAILIGIASVFDFMDGMAARLLNAYSELGKQLDSLADLISFGFAPSIILFVLMKKSLAIDSLSFNQYSEIAFLAIPFLIVVFSAIRLAKFNVDTRQTSSFIGLPTPANALLIASFPLILHYSGIEVVKDVLLNEFFLVSFVVFQSFMLISELPMFSLKFSNFRLGDNKLRYIFLFISLILLITLYTVSIPIIIFLYIIMSIINNSVSAK